MLRNEAQITRRVWEIHIYGMANSNKGLLFSIRKNEVIFEIAVPMLISAVCSFMYFSNGKVFYCAQRFSGTATNCNFNSYRLYSYAYNLETMLNF